MNNAHFLTKQYLKLLQTMVYMSNKGLSISPVQHVIRRNVEERKIISEMIAFYELEGMKKYGLNKDILENKQINKKASLFSRTYKMNTTQQ